MNGKHTLPADIERTSMAIITQELAAAALELPPQHAAVVKRVIHTTADFDYAQSLRFTPDAVATRRGGAAAGRAHCNGYQYGKSGRQQAQPGEARRHGGMLYGGRGRGPRRAGKRHHAGGTRPWKRPARNDPGAVLAVGNAPTALLRLEALIADGCGRRWSWRCPWAL